MVRTALAVSVLLVLSLATNSAAQPDPAWRLTDIAGKSHEPFEEESTRALVLVFISTDCPIANSYQPLLRRLAEEYQSDDVRFLMVHPSSTLSVDEARKHANDFDITAPIVIDSDQSLARRVGATVTPQAFVFTRNQAAPVYQGRIDNLYAGYGKKRSVATTHELADALEAVAGGFAVRNAKTKPVGCFISYAK